MKIKIELEYNDEQIQYFAQQKGRTSEDLEVFIVDFLKNYITELVSAPFIDKVRMERIQEEIAMNNDIKQRVIDGMVIQSTL